MVFRETLDSPISMPVAIAGGVTLILREWYQLAGFVSKLTHL